MNDDHTNRGHVNQGTPVNDSNTYWTFLWFQPIVQTEDNQILENKTEQDFFTRSICQPTA